ncbi:MAG: hypothetical protein K6A39_01345 [Clostridiales bacterium]|nr:hypothetical protein [Clostridiales bacterium]
MGKMAVCEYVTDMADYDRGDGKPGYEIGSSYIIIIDETVTILAEDHSAGGCTGQIRCENIHLEKPCL